MWRQLKVKNLNIEGPMGNLSCDLLCNWTKLKVELGTHKIDFDVCKTCDQNTASNYLWYHCKLRIPIFHQSSFLPQTCAYKRPLLLTCTRSCPPASKTNCHSIPCWFEHRWAIARKKSMQTDDWGSYFYYNCFCLFVCFLGEKKCLFNQFISTNIPELFPISESKLQFNSC